MQRAKSLDARREAAQDWAINWQADHDQVIHSLERAIGAGQIADAGRWLGQLKALNDKAMSALPRVIDALSDEDIV